VLGYEALARGPNGSALADPDKLFAAADESGRIAELDWACRIAALEGALDGGINPPLSVFVNIEARTSGSPFPSPMPEAFARALSELDVIFELTERALTDQPAELLETIMLVREFGCGIALDDVGANRRSLALMPLVNPDVIKLDLRLVQDQPTAKFAEIAGAVQTQAEATGATVLAEGIETEDHVFTAQALGATLGQGYLFGAPRRLPDEQVSPSRSIQIRPRVERGLRTPFDVATQSRPARRGRHDLMVAMSRKLEKFAYEAGSEGVLIGSFQTGDRFAAMRRRYAKLAQHMPLVAALGSGLGPEPEGRVRGGHIEDDDPLMAEWVVAVLGPQMSAALAARDLGHDGPASGRQFDFAVTYNRGEVVDIARMLLTRIRSKPRG
jgi:EAL domain-containing protein (putative c-di-GMP-specific phosphodiesterase class I)